MMAQIVFFQGVYGEAAEGLNHVEMVHKVTSPPTEIFYNINVQHLQIANDLFIPFSPFIVSELHILRQHEL